LKFSGVIANEDDILPVKGDAGETSKLVVVFFSEAGKVTFHLVYGMGGGGIGEVRRELAGLFVFNN
jgi:hypothetical protein